LHEIGPTELYFPVAEHRERWTGERELLVATTMSENELPFAVSSRGDILTLSNDAPPKTPTLVIVPAEGFDRDGNPTRLKQYINPEIRLNVVVQGIASNHIHIDDLHEPWPNGSPEIEIHTQDRSVPRQVQCNSKNSPAGSTAGYRFDMNSNNYSTDFFLLASGSLNSLRNYVVSIWEDDDVACVVIQFDGLLGNDYVKWAADRLAGQNSIYKPQLRLNGSWSTSSDKVFVSHGTTPFWGSDDGGDDFIGIIAGVSNLTTTQQRFTIFDDLGHSEGYADLQWRTWIE
jgi:hypothetical protein